MNNPFFDQARDGCKKAEAESGGKFVCEYIGPGEHGGGEEQVQIVQDLVARGDVKGIGVAPANAAAMAVALQAAKDAGIPVLTWDSRPAAGEQGPARRLHRHAQLRDRRQPRQARPGDQARGRHGLHPVGRRRGGQPQRAHAGHPRHARRQDRHHLARRAADRGERLDRGPGLPALHQRRLPACGPAVPGLHGGEPRPRRLPPDRRLPAVRAGRQPRRGRALQGADRRRLAGARRRRHAAGADRPDEGGPLGRPGRPAAVRDGLPGDAGLPADGRRRRRARRTRPTPASTSARRRRSTPASRSRPG